MDEDAQVREWIEFACQRNGCADLAPKITYKFGRLRRCQGLAHCAICPWIEIDSRFWAKATVEEKRRLIIHETCHLTTDAIYGDDDGTGCSSPRKSRRASEAFHHGRNWQRAMEKCGLKDALESYAPDGTRPRPRQAKYLAECGCSGTRKITEWDALLIGSDAAPHCDLCRQPIQLKYPCPPVSPLAAAAGE